MEINTPSFAFLHATYYSDRIVPTLKDGKPLDVKPTPSQKIGIKVYTCVLGWILSLFGVAVTLRDAHNRIYFVNKKSLIGWATANGSNQTNTWRELDQLLHYIHRPQQDPIDNGECGICFEKLENFITLDCKHVFCVPCMKEWMVVKKNSPTCPFDQSNLSPNDLRRIQAAI